MESGTLQGMKTRTVPVCAHMILIVCALLMLTIVAGVADAVAPHQPAAADVSVSSAEGDGVSALDGDVEGGEVEAGAIMPAAARLLCASSTTDCQLRRPYGSPDIPHELSF